MTAPPETGTDERDPRWPICVYLPMEQACRYYHGIRLARGNLVYYGIGEWAFGHPNDDVEAFPPIAEISTDTVQ